MDVLVATFPNRKIEVVERRNFHGEMQTGTVLDLRLVAWRASGMISRGPSFDDLHLILPLRRGVFEFADRSFELDPNGLYLIDDRQAHVSRTVESMSENVLVRLPRDELARRVSIADVVNRPIAAQGDAALLAAFVRDVIRVGPSTLSPAAAALAREQMLDLTAVAIGNLVGVKPRLGLAGRLGTLRLRAAIDAQLANPDLDRHSIAVAAGISERHANRLLALEGTSIRRLLMERRLDKCRAALEDPLQLRSIGEVARQCGFRDLSYFTRAFKSRFGFAPSECRSTSGPGGSSKSHSIK